MSWLCSCELDFSTGVSWRIVCVASLKSSERNQKINQLSLDKLIAPFDSVGHTWAASSRDFVQLGIDVRQPNAAINV